MKERRKEILIFIILIYIVLIIIICEMIETYKDMQTERKIEPYTPEITNIVENKATEIEETKEVKQYPKEQIIEKYKGYEVSAKLEIPNINLKTYVLREYSTKALNISVTKFWGVEPNQIGNCCIAGHNFKNKNMFRNLKKLNIGDKLTITDNEIGKVQYEIFDIYTVLPKDTNCLIPENKGQREITLITCTSDSKKRIIVKAKEV